MMEATNTTATGCYLYGYPVIRFVDGQQAVPGTNENSKPQAVTYLEPGATGYAAVQTSSAGSTNKGQSTTSLIVALQRADPGAGSAGTPVTVAAPGGGITVDLDNVLLGYWVNDASTAQNS